MKSLFIISLPRSLSTQVHRMACAALDLRSPAWTSAGEILNADRSVLHGGPSGGLKFTTPQHSNSFGPAQDFLSQVVSPDGFGYKDVVQPFVVSQWLRDHPATRVLKIMPNIAHVALAMLGRHWLYPTVAAADGHCLEERMVSGLMRATRALDGVPGEAVAYDDLIEDFEPLRLALGRLYPDRSIGALLPDPAFPAQRETVLQRRHCALYRELQQVERGMRRGAVEAPATRAMAV